MIRLMVRFATLWDEGILPQRMVAVGVSVICVAAGFAMDSPVLGVAAAVGFQWGFVHNGVWRRKPAVDRRSSSADPTDVDYLKVLRARGDGDVETLIGVLQDDVDASLAAKFLGDIGAVSAISELVPLLEAADPQHRASAAGALAKLNASTACPRIVEIAQGDDVPWVRASAIQAAADLGCDDDQLLRRALDDPDLCVRRTAVVVLMDVGQPDAIPALRAARKRERWFSRRIYSKAIRRLKRRSGG